MQDYPVRPGEPAPHDGCPTRDVQTMNPPPPPTNYTPLTKEQIKRRSYWIDFVLHGFHFAVWIIFTIWLYNGGRPK